MDFNRNNGHGREKEVWRNVLEKRLALFVCQTSILWTICKELRLCVLCFVLTAQTVVDSSCGYGCRERFCRIASSTVLIADPILVVSHLALGTVCSVPELSFLTHWNLINGYFLEINILKIVDSTNELCLVPTEHSPTQDLPTMGVNSKPNTNTKMALVAILELVYNLYHGSEGRTEIC